MKHISLKNREILLAVMFGLALLGQFERFTTPVGLINFHEIGMIAFLTTLAYPLFASFSELYNSEKTLKRGVGLGFLFIIWTLLTTLINARQLDSPLLLKTGTAYLARLVLYLVFLSGIFLSYRWKFVRSAVVTRIVVLWLLLVAATGIGQYLFFPDARGLLILGWDEHLNRAFGTLLDPGFFGLLMAVGAVYALQRWVEGSVAVRRWLWPIVYSTFLLALTLSFSRASYLAYIAGTIVLAWVIKSRRTLLFIPLLVMALVLVPKDGGGEGQKLDRTNSLAARVEVAQFHTEGLALPEVLVGRGWYYESARQLHRLGVQKESGGKADDNLDTPSHSQAVDNSYLHVFLSTGIIGFSLFLAFLGGVIWKMRHRPQLAMLAAVLAHSFFSTALFYPWVLLTFVLLLDADQRKAKGSTWKR